MVDLSWEVVAGCQPGSSALCSKAQRMKCILGKDLSRKPSLRTQLKLQPIYPSHSWSWPIFTVFQKIYHLLSAGDNYLFIICPLPQLDYVPTCMARWCCFGKESVRTSCAKGQKGWWWWWGNQKEKFSYLKFYLNPSLNVKGSLFSLAGSTSYGILYKCTNIYKNLP